MEIEIRDIDEQTIKQLLPPCNSCLYWEAPEKYGKDEKGEPKTSKDEAIIIKQGWFKNTGSTFGSCGKILYIDGKAAGYIRYAPSHLFEKVTEYSQELFPPSPDALLLSCLHIQSAYREKGLGTRLLQTVLEDLRGRGYQAVETYSRDDANGSSGPTVLYLENGFRVLKKKKWKNAAYSLVRLDF